MCRPSSAPVESNVAVLGSGAVAVFAGARGQQRAVVEVERVDAADLDARHVAGARRVPVSAARTHRRRAAGARERRRRVGRQPRPRTLLP